MNLKSSIHSRFSTRKFRTQLAFTLIELLVVIAIIGILAALTVGLSGVAQAKMRRARVEAEREQLISVIESYKKAKGFYPPDDPNTPTAYVGYTYQNTLFYELTGCTIQGDPGAPPFFYKATVTGELMKNSDVTNSFNVGGILNSSTDPTAVVNYFSGLKANQHAIVAAPSGAAFSVLGVSVPGPVQLSPSAASGTTSIMNPWNYVLTNPTNNPGSFDLWMDVYWSGKTNRVCNWSRDPIVL